MALKNPLTYRRGANSLRIRGVNISVNVNGPGRRLVVHFQGCDLACAGCFNQELWAPSTRKGVETIATAFLARRLQNMLLSDRSIQGITFSGGEPFQQGEEFLTLLALLRSKSSGFDIPNIAIFTGYTLEELDSYLSEGLRRLLMRSVDFLVSGRFIQSLAVTSGSTYASSSNQRVTLFGTAYTNQALTARQFSVDVLVDSVGNSIMTGFPDDTTVRRMSRVATERNKTL